MTLHSREWALVFGAALAAALVAVYAVALPASSTSGNSVEGTPTPTATPPDASPTPSSSPTPLPSPSPISTVSASELQAQRVKWTAAGIDSYRYVVRLYCFCGFPQPYTITVRNGATESLVDEKGQSVTDYPSLAKLTTVEGLFAEVEFLTIASYYSADVVYDATYGFPSEISYDTAAWIADDELTVRVSDFKILQPESLPRTGGQR